MNAFISYFLLLLSFLESVSLAFHDSHILIAPQGSHVNHKLSVFSVLSDFTASSSPCLCSLI